MWRRCLYLLWKYYMIDTLANNVTSITSQVVVNLRFNVTFGPLCFTIVSSCFFLVLFSLARSSSSASVHWTCFPIFFLLACDNLQIYYKWTHDLMQLSNIFGTKNLVLTQNLELIVRIFQFLEFDDVFVKFCRKLSKNYK